MLEFLSVPVASKAVLLASPSYYRLAADDLMPPVVKLAKNRSGVIKDELEAVKRARAVGMADDEVRTLVQNLVAQRAERFSISNASASPSPDDILTRLQVVAPSTPPLDRMTADELRVVADALAAALELGR